MKLYAVLQSLRYLLIICFIVVLALVGWPENELAFTFTISESLLFLVLLGFMWRYLSPSGMGQWRSWCARHTNFAVKSFFNSLLLEINTRVDVLMLGYFCTDFMVGIYSFAAMLAEGFFQIMAAVIRVVTPKLVTYWATGDKDGLLTFKSIVVKNTYKWMTVTGGLVILSYPLWIQIIGPSEEFRDTWGIFAIISGAVVVSSGYLPLRNILQASGYPGWQTIQTMILVLINIVGNLTLIPLFGVNGAALGTAASILAVVVLVKLMTRWKLGLSI